MLSTAPPPPPPPPSTATVLAARAPVPGVPVGRSVAGRPLRVLRQGSADADVRVLVVGQIHGDEPGGRRVVAALRGRSAPAGTAIHTIATVNPDGAQRRTRQNSRGVDLNRNFPASWRTGRRGRFYPGPRPASEPETRWVQTVVRAIRPDVTVWLHQPYALIDASAPARRTVLSSYARRVELPLRRLPRYFGTATRWQRATYPRDEAFVVELGARRPTDAEVMRHVRAIEWLARDLAAEEPHDGPTGPTGPSGPSGAAGTTG